MNRAVTTTVVSLITGVLASACSSSAQPTASQSVAPPSASPTDPQAATRVAVLASYTGMWGDLETDASTANWKNPTLVHHATGKALLELDEDLAVDDQLGLVGKGHAVLRPTIIGMTPDATPTGASVMDCADLHSFVKVVKATGLPQDHTPGGKHLVQASLTLKGGVWKVSELAIGSVGSC